jgi:hypothetical protein
MGKLPRDTRPPRRILLLAYSVEVEADTDDSAAATAIIDDIEAQVSGQPRELTLDDGRTITYQVNAMNGWTD